jgi:hypothetical protein
MASSTSKTSSKRWRKVDKYVLEKGEFRIVAGKITDKWSYLVYENKVIHKNFWRLPEAKSYVNSVIAKRENGGEVAE